MKENKTSWLTEHAGDILSYGGLALCILLFTILSKVNGNDFWSAYNLKKLIEQVCVYAILTVGAVFIYSMGAMDISVGAQIGVLYHPDSHRKRHRVSIGGLPGGAGTGTAVRLL